MNIIFAGTPGFAATTLEALIASSYQISAVYTQPDRPAGRGRHLTASPVKQCAINNNLFVYQPKSLCDPEGPLHLAEHRPDIMVVVAYGLLLPEAILRVPRLGCINIHASLLPRWRGAAPIQRAILAGDKTTGISIMQMEAGLDTGPILYQVSCNIEEQDTGEILHDRLASLGSQALLTTLNQLGSLQPQRQNDKLATYAKKIFKQEAELDWRCAAVELAQKIRAFNAWPVAFTQIKGQTIRVWDAVVVPEPARPLPGEVMRVGPAGIDIATGQHVLRILKIQLPGGRALPVLDILNARRGFFAVGQRLGNFI